MKQRLSHSHTRFKGEIQCRCLTHSNKQGLLLLSLLNDFKKLRSSIYFFSYAIYLCFGIPPYFIGTYHRLIFLLAENGILSPD